MATVRERRLRDVTHLAFRVLDAHAGATPDDMEQLTIRLLRVIDDFEALIAWRQKAQERTIAAGAAQEDR